MLKPKHILLILGFLGLTACGGSGGGGDSSSGGGSGNNTPVIDESKITANCFTASSSNPLLTTGSGFTDANWNDPSVLKVGSSYIMYASADTNSFDLK